jgi:Zn-dependent peptidase ImmA (M78 family)
VRLGIKFIINFILSKIFGEKIMTLQNLFNTTQLAKEFGVSPQRIRYMISKKFPDLKKEGRDWLLNILQVEALKNRRTYVKKLDK